MDLLVLIMILAWIVFFLPCICFLVAAFSGFLRMIRHKAWCTWTPVLAGPFFVLGDISRRFAVWNHRGQHRGTNPMDTLLE